MQNLIRVIREQEQSLRRFQCLDGLALRLIALITMTIDHTAAVLIRYGPLYWPMRGIGRIAFPIYCFLLVEGYCRTHSRGKYLLRLLVFFVIAEIPFDRAFFYTWYAPGYQNVLLTLAIGLCAVWASDRCGAELEKRTGKGSGWAVWLLRLLIVTAGYCLGELLMTDYSGGGVLLILAFYFLKDYPICLTAAMSVLLCGCFGLVELPGILALLPIFLYNGERGKRLPSVVGKYGFYAYYPLHIALLALMRFVLYGY